MKTKEKIVEILIEDLGIFSEKIAQNTCLYCEAEELDCGRCSERSRFKLGNVSKLLANEITNKILE